MDKKQLDQIMTSEFVNQLCEMETAEEVKSALEEKGIELSIPEIEKLQKKLENQVSSQTELSEDDLEDVSGGGIFETLAGYFLEGFDCVDRWTRRRW